MALEITDASFEKEVLQESLPVLVDFWAKWCGPCRALAPTIEELSTQYNGKVKICKLEVDENPEKASEYNIRSIPTLILFKNGEKIEQLVGGASKEAIEKLINDNI
ncbi:MAG: thioredoxin [Desulfovibrionaceae bacterium]|nr:thioredoxin [Desulfovibrionaceae bacterium]